MIKQAYIAGVKLAATEAGLFDFIGNSSDDSLSLKEYLLPALLGPLSLKKSPALLVSGLGGTLAAPEGSRWQGYGGSLLGAVLGGFAGKGVSSVLSKKLQNPRLWTEIVPALLGSSAGSVLGYRKATR